MPVTPLPAGARADNKVVTNAHMPTIMVGGQGAMPRGSTGMPVSWMTEPSETDNEQLMTVEEVAAMLRMDKQWVYKNSSRKGGLPSMKVGHFLRFDKGQVRAWLSEQNVKKS